MVGCLAALNIGGDWPSVQTSFGKVIDLDLFAFSFRTPEVSQMSIRLYVGNLSKDLERQEFESVFADFNADLVSIKLIADKKTGKCRGFGFVTVKTDEKADEIIEKFNGQVLADMPLKIEKALPRTKPEGETDARPSSNSGGKRSSKSGSRKAAPAAAAATSSAAAQPDPRWAGELEKLKQMLAAQTTSS